MAMTTAPNSSQRAERVCNRNHRQSTGFWPGLSAFQLKLQSTSAELGEHNSLFRV